MAATKWGTEETIRSGHTVHALSVQHRDVIEPRAGASVIDTLKADIEQLRGEESGFEHAVLEQKVATGSQNQAAQLAADVVSGIRSTVRATFPHNKAVQTAFGVGQGSSNSVRSLVTSLQTILSAADADPSRTREAGILPKDLDRARNALRDLQGTDEVQESKKLGARAASVQRRSTQSRVEEAVTRLVGIATLAFADRPEIAAQFRNALPSKGNSRKKPAEAVKAATPSSTPESK
jgi:hypothetical protein